MRKQNKSALLLISLVVLAVVAVTGAVQGTDARLTTPTGQEQTPRTNERIRRRGLPSRDDLPVTDASRSDESNRNSPARRARQHRYNHDYTMQVQPHVLSENSLPDLFDLPISHESRPAIPAAQSDTVVIGEVTDAQSFLSADRTSIYSEFTLQVQEVLKNTSSQTVAPYSSITLERWGGAIRFPSGRVLRRGRLLDRMPRAQRQYLFFLRSQSETDSFQIITGYELRAGRVYPLDGVDLPEDGRTLPQFARYEGVEVATFLEEVRRALSEAAQSPAPAQKAQPEEAN